MDQKPVSNYDLLKRIEAVEVQLKTLLEVMDQGKGVVTFLKFMSSAGIFIAVVFGAIHTWWYK